MLEIGRKLPSSSVLLVTESKIETIDFRSTMTASAPFLLGVTLDD